jgi:hypothetical protein
MKLGIRALTIVLTGTRTIARIPLPSLHLRKHFIQCRVDNAHISPRWSMTSYDIYVECDLVTSLHAAYVRGVVGELVASAQVCVACSGVAAVSLLHRVFDGAGRIYMGRLELFLHEDILECMPFSSSVTTAEPHKALCWAPDCNEMLAIVHWRESHYEEGTYTTRFWNRHTRMTKDWG